LKFEVDDEDDIDVAISRTKWKPNFDKVVAVQMHNPTMDHSMFLNQLCK
jgi:hypothetical protein